MTAWSNASCRRRRSRSRPTIGESNRLTRSDAAAAASRTRQPPGAGSTVTASRRTARVAASIRISPGAASSPSRWRNVSGSPVALAWAASVSARHDLPRADPDPKIELEGALGAERGRQVEEARARVGSGSHRSQRVVLVHQRKSEHRGDRVARHSRDRSAVPVGSSFEGPERSAGHAPQGLWIERPAAHGSDANSSRRAPSPSFAHRGSPIRRPGARQTARRPPWDAARRSRAGRGADPA